MVKKCFGQERMRIFVSPPARAGRYEEENDDHYGRSGGSVDVVIKSRIKPKKPSMYKVVLLNDDYTPMDFVAQILESVFNKPVEEAMRIVLQVHQKGSGVCGVYTYEIAETKVAIVLALARESEHPLQCVMEKA